MQFKKGDIIQCISSTYEFKSSLFGIYFKVHKHNFKGLFVKCIDQKDYGKSYFYDVIKIDRNIYFFRKIPNFDYIILKLKGIVV